ncbi:hypothetical protein OSTOST_04504 [Ostertagia ostertagi]
MIVRKYIPDVALYAEVLSSPRADAFIRSDKAEMRIPCRLQAFIGTHPCFLVKTLNGKFFEEECSKMSQSSFYDENNNAVGADAHPNEGTVQVLNGSDLVGDPALLPHVCLPRKNAQDRVTRLVYKSCQEIAKDGRLVNARPRELWQNMAEQVHYQEGTS